MLLQVEGCDVKYSTEGDDKIKECRPGKPFIVYKTEVSRAGYRENFQNQLPMWKNLR